MAETYFGNLRKVGASVDEGLAKLQDTWNMPHILLCNSSDETQNNAKELVENIKTELKVLRDEVEKSKNLIIPLQESFTQELDKNVEEVNVLKKELDEIKVLFIENGYIEEEQTESDLSVLNNQLEALSVDNSYSFTKDVGDLTHSSMFDNNGLNDSVNAKTPKNNRSCERRKPLSLNEPPLEPMYSPCYYKIIKK